MDLGGMADKAKQAAHDNPDAVDKAGDFANDRTGGQHEEHINKAGDALKGDQNEGEGN